MTDEANVIMPTVLKRIFTKIFEEEDAIVLVVNPDNEVIDYRVEPLSDVVALLAINGFGEPVEHGC